MKAAEHGQVTDSAGRPVKEPCSKSCDVIVIGAGISGLAVAHFLARAGARAIVVEKEHAVGGQGCSFEADGTNIERALHGVFPGDRHLLRLTRKLMPGVRPRWVDAPFGLWSNGSCRLLGGTRNVVGQRPSIGQRWRMVWLGLLGNLCVSLPGQETCSAEDWCRRHAGDANWTEYMEPLIRCRWRTRSNHISARWLSGRMKARFQANPIRFGKVGYLEGGSHGLFDALTGSLNQLGGQLLLGTTVEHCFCNDCDTVTALCVQGSRSLKLQAEQVILTSPTLSSRWLCQAMPERAVEMGTIDYQHAMSLVVGTDRPVVPLFQVADATLEAPFAVVTDMTPLLGGEERAVAYFTYYCDDDSPLLHMSREELLVHSLRAVHRMFPAISPKVRWSHLTHFPNSVPVYGVSFWQSQRIWQRRTSPVFHLGLHSTYPNDYNTAVRDADRLARCILRGRRWAERPLPRKLS